MGMERTLSNTFSVEIKEEEISMGMTIDFTGKTVLITGGGRLDGAVNAAGIVH